jgi:hypothetical protein
VQHGVDREPRAPLRQLGVVGRARKPAEEQLAAAHERAEDEWQADGDEDEYAVVVEAARANLGMIERGRRVRRAGGGRT